MARAGDKTLALSLAGCDDAHAPIDRLLELIRSELVAADFVIIAASAPSAVRGAIRLCHGSPELVWMSVAVASQPPVERTVDLGDVEGELRARTVAVAFAELLTTLPPGPARSISASGSTPKASEPATAPSLAQPAADGARPQETDRERSSQVSAEAAGPAASLAIGAGLGLRVFARPTTVFGGPWLSFGWARLQAEVSYLQASNRVPLGTAHMRALGAAAVWSPWHLGVSPRVSLHCRGELGMTWATGSPTGDRAIGATRHHEQAALAVESRVDVRGSSTLALQARLTAGLAYGPTATADGVAAARASGPFVGAALGVNVSF
jgi:hypothetical protein